MDEIISNFKIDGEQTAKKKIERGLINSTYLYTFLHDGTEKKYIVQEINTFVFNRPEEVMQNIVNVTSYLKDKGCNTLNVIFTKDNLPYYKTGDNRYFRCYDFIENTFVLNEVQSEEEAFCAGKAFGKFLYMLRDYPTDTLFETIKDFHNTKNRYDLFTAALEKDEFDRKKDLEEFLDAIEEKSKYAFLIIEEYNNYSIKHRVTHNDTKINNVLFDKDTKESYVIDLDTIMPGTMLYDLGDAVMTSAIRDNKLDLSLFESYIKGYFSECRDVLTKREIELIPLAVKAITFELAIRFLTDYLENDIYFHTDYENENLDRGKSVLISLDDIETKEKEMEKIINSI